MLPWTCCFARAGLSSKVSVGFLSMVAKGARHHAVRTKSYYSSNSSPGVGGTGTWKDSVQPMGPLFAMLSAAALAASFVVSTRKDLELAKLSAKKDIELVEERAKTDIEKAKKEIEIAKKETAERFLMYGYAAEFQRYQEKVKMGDHYQSEKNGKDSAKDEE